MRRTLILYLALITALPVALLATVLPVNSYQAEGIDALDCDGPASVLLFAIPALLIYGAGAILLYRKRIGAFILSPPSVVPRLLLRRLECRCGATRILWGGLGRSLRLIRGCFAKSQ